MFWPWRTAVAVQERIAANSGLSQGIVGPVVNPLVVIPPIDQAGEQGVVFAFQLRGAG
jgi:hypothetical protein